MSVAEAPSPVIAPPAPSRSRLPTAADPYSDAPSDTSFEVVNGVRVEKPMSLYEQVVAGLLHERLAPHCRENGLGRAVVETAFAIPLSGNDRKPDAAFVSYQSWPRDRGIPRTNAWRIAPDLAVEVVSPTDRMFDVFDKVHEYFRGGVREVWLVLSSVGEVHVYSSPTSVRILTRADDLTGDPVVPGFRLPLADLFPPAEPTPATP